MHTPLKRILSSNYACVLAAALMFVCEENHAQQTPTIQQSVTQGRAAGATTQPAPSAPRKAIQTNPLRAVSTVKENIVVEAGLLTPPSATQLFGGWIAEHFLVVQVTISNQSRDEQFVLHDVFLDYSNWKLSGIYGSTATDPTQDAHPLGDFQSGTKRGQISSIGALEMQDSLKQNSVFSKRNFFINGLVLVGSTAGGFTFLGPVGFTEGVAGYSSSFIPALQKFWPDRRIDQQSNVLKYGFQDKMVIAKEDPGKTYAFFPIERLLTNGLAKVYREDSALFLNMGQLYLDPSIRHHRRHQSLKITIDKLIINQFPQPKEFSCNIGTRNKPNYQKGSNCAGTNELQARVLQDLFSPCYLGKSEDQEPNCLFPAIERNKVTNNETPSLLEIRNVKDIISGLSLNAVRVVASGIMTVDVELVPSVLTSVQVSDNPQGSSIWEDTKENHQGQITGRYLLNGIPTVDAIKVPSDSSAQIGDYFASNQLMVFADQSTDSKLQFIFKLKKAVPPDTVITFRVTRTSNKSASGNADTQQPTTSMGLDFVVKYTATPATGVSPVSDQPAPAQAVPADTLPVQPTPAQPAPAKTVLTKPKRSSAPLPNPAEGGKP